MSTQHQLQPGDTARTLEGDVVVIDVVPAGPVDASTAIGYKYVEGPYSGTVGLARNGDLEWIPDAEVNA